MKLHFYKYQGTGNDFVMIDDRAQVFDETDYARIAHLCHRRFGIGADGLILLRNKLDFDFEMVYFNADGRPSSMCGNGGRCTVAFARFLGVIGDQTRFLAVDGPHESRLDANGTVHLKMQDVLAPEAVGDGDAFLNTGSPHHVRFLPTGLADLNVFAEGRALRYGPRYGAAGANINFVEPPATPAQPWSVRTYERGVEDETLSCGTGVTAVALAASERGANSPVRLCTPGGELEVAFQKQPNGSFIEVWLSGPAVQVFAGIVEV